MEADRFRTRAHVAGNVDLENENTRNAIAATGL